MKVKSEVSRERERFKNNVIDLAAPALVVGVISLGIVAVFGLIGGPLATIVGALRGDVVLVSVGVLWTVFSAWFTCAAVANHYGGHFWHPRQWHFHVWDVTELGGNDKRRVCRVCDEVQAWRLRRWDGLMDEGVSRRWGRAPV